MSATTDPRRTLPAVGTLLENVAVRALLERAPRSLVTDAVRDAIETARRDPASSPRDEQQWADAVGAALERRSRASLRPLINATGVILHTNLGRAPLAAAALDAIRIVAEGACNLEYDLERGVRGSRTSHCVALLRELTGADDALVVNNCASALVLALNTVADGREAIVSRGELIEIGGSFRVPDIMAKSGARLVEVGTTNRTHVDDYRHAMSDRTGALMKVHRSNFEVRGFVAEVTSDELVAIARPLGIPVLHDFGSGLLLSLEAFGLRGEPTAADVVRTGASLVLMSGDKLLGGPQAGIIVGDAALVTACRKNPLARAVRVDKLTLAALEATLALYRDPAVAIRAIPVLAMLTAAPAGIEGRATRLARLLVEGGIAGAVVTATEATVGGGAFPTARVPSFGVALPGNAEAIERRLREATLPVIGRIAEGRVLLDVRSVPATLDHTLADAVTSALR